MKMTKTQIVNIINNATPFKASNRNGLEVNIQLKADRSSSRNIDKNERFAQSGEYKQLVNLFGADKVKLMASRFNRYIVISR